ncbi:MAG: hypothetical protein FWE33_04595 [Defluviitaleaceae bacterium]|nr:hypothetical protein [Defluviitaleaceae bacterium]
MDKQKENDILRNAVLLDDARAVTEIINDLPRDFKLLFVGQVLGFATAKGIDTNPPPTPTVEMAAEIAV